MLKSEFLIGKLTALPLRKMFKVMGEAMQKLEALEQEDFLHNWQAHAQDALEVCVRQQHF